ncbi:hypothetical protein [Pseudomonas sp. KNUC1026]|uniref:hypothetical protein n=1 Tax=Pseudomonas sp. KNUC1026 TaxID=2893890 RepID=UPI003FA7618F
MVTDDSSRGLVRQNDEIQQAATAVNEMTAAVEEVARNAAGASPGVDPDRRGGAPGPAQGA